jgi:hypothetical protein
MLGARDGKPLGARGASLGRGRPTTVALLLSSALSALFGGSARAGGQQCISLEGLQIGCVASFDHTCSRNVMIDRDDAPCYYVGKPATFLRVEAPIAWRCKSSRETRVCRPSGASGESSGEICTTHSECLEYYPPSCDEECVPCFETVVQKQTGLSRGCLVCTREYCPDEPEVTTACAPTFGDLVAGTGTRCSSGSRCPTTAIDPLGKSHTVKVRSARGCEPPQLPEPKDIPRPQHCPWTVDTRSATGCEPIPPWAQNKAF